MDLELNVSKKGLSTTEEVINEEYTLRYGHIFRGPKGDSGEKGAKGDNGKSPKVSETNTWLVYDDELKTYVDTGIKASGSDNNYSDADKALVQTIPSKVDKIEGKGLSTNDYSDEDEALVQTIPDKVSQEEFDEATAGLSDAINDIGDVLATKADKNGSYPDMTVGKSENLVGRGDTQDATINFRPSGGVPDVGNGMNITDGTARIKAIKGNSVVWNQRHSTPYTIDYNVLEGATFTYYYPANFENYTYADGVATWVGKPNLSSGVSIASRVDVGHKMLTIAKIKCSVADLLIAKKNNKASDNTGSYISTDWNEYARIVDAPDGDWRGGMCVSVATAKQNSHDGYTCEIKDIQQFDLTQMFGAGNEPKSYEEYLQRKPMNIADEFAYKEGVLLDMKVDELVSVGDNAYNPIEQKARVIGGQKYHITDSANTEDLVVTFYAFDEDINEEREVEPIVEDGKKYYIFPANGYCLVNDKVGEICVCLEHSYEKPIKPYEVNVKDFSFIKEIATKQGELLFPNGMRSAGSAYDEIRYDVTKKKWEAVKRIGKVDASTLDWYKKTDTIGGFSAANGNPSGSKNILTSKYSIVNGFLWNNFDSITDQAIGIGTSTTLFAKFTDCNNVAELKVKLNGVHLYYELAKPIVVEIPNSENWNLDYLVWDFGTEEALVRDSTIDNPIPSAPFQAEINYEPNAVDDLRWSIKYIRALEQRVLALEQKAEQETNIEEV